MSSAKVFPHSSSIHIPPEPIKPVSILAQPITLLSDNETEKNSVLLHAENLQERFGDSSSTLPSDLLIHTASFLDQKDHAAAMLTSRLFNAVFNSAKCWRKLYPVCPDGISRKELAIDLFPMVLRNDLLCASLKSIDPKILLTALKRIYQFDENGKVKRDEQKNRVYALDPLEGEKFIKDTFVLFVPRKTLPIEDRKHFVVKEDELIPAVQNCPNNLNHIGKFMKQKHKTNYDTERFWPAILEQYGEVQISQSLRFLRKDPAFHNMSTREQWAKATECKLLISSLFEQTILNFINYAKNKRFIDVGSDPLRNIKTRTLAKDKDNRKQISVCIGWDDTFMLVKYNGCPRSHAVALSFDCSNN
jgi:hypothetical protein